MDSPWGSTSRTDDVSLGLCERMCKMGMGLFEDVIYLCAQCIEGNYQRYGGVLLLHLENK